MAESTHSIYKTEFMRRKHSVDKAQHLKDLERFVQYYNYERFPCEHFGFTPMEVLEGAKPNRFMFTQQIAEARKDRVLKNQVFNECQLLCYAESAFSAEDGNPDKSGQAMRSIVKKE
jgi:hypothetical protein